MNVAEMFAEVQRLSRLIDKGIAELREQSIAVAAAEAEYRKAKAEAWIRCPNDDAGVRAGEREWTAARREAWVEAETADLRYARDLADGMRDTAREAVRSRRQQLSAVQSVLAADRAEAEFARTGPQVAA